MIEAWAVRILLALGVGFAAWLHGMSVGSERTQAKWDAAVAKADRDASAARERQREAEDKLRIDHAKTISGINARLADALERLRERPDRRVPDAATPSCAGATGADLSAADAGFLVREAARADRLRSALSECYAVIDSAGEVPGEAAGH